MINGKSSKERDVQKSVLQDYFKANQIAGSGDYAKNLLLKYFLILLKSDYENIEVP